MSRHLLNISVNVYGEYIYFLFCWHCFLSSPHRLSIKEHLFWRNYFYRVNLIREAHGIITKVPLCVLCVCPFSSHGSALYLRLILISALFRVVTFSQSPAPRAAAPQQTRTQTQAETETQTRASAEGAADAPKDAFSAEAPPHPVVDPEGAYGYKTHIDIYVHLNGTCTRIVISYRLCIFILSVSLSFWFFIVFSSDVHRIEQHSSRRARLHKR